MREIGIYKEKQAESAEIQKQIEKYLEKGGEIKQIEVGMCTHSKKLDGSSWRTDNYEER